MDALDAILDASSKPPHCWDTNSFYFCHTSSSFAGNNKLVAVEDSIDVSNIIYIIYNSLYSFTHIYIYV